MGFAPKDQVWLHRHNCKGTVVSAWLDNGVGKATVLWHSNGETTEVLIKDLNHKSDFSSPSAKGQ